MDVTLTDFQLKEISKKYLSQILDWKENYYISSDGKVCYNAVYYSSHSWGAEKEVRQASEQDYFAAGIFKLINQQKHGQNQQNP